MTGNTQDTKSRKSWNKTGRYSNRLDTTISRRRNRNTTQHKKTLQEPVETNIHMACPIQNNGATKCTDMNPEFLQQHQENRQTFQIDQLIQAVSNIAIQSNLTNQTMLSFFFSQTDRHTNRPDPRVRPKSFSGLPSEDILSWLDHFEMVASYHQWSETRKALEMRTLLEGIATTWFIQQREEAKNNWPILKSFMIGNFAHHDSTETALQQLETIKQQQHEPVTQFAVWLQQLVTLTNPTMRIDKAILLMATATPRNISSSARSRPQNI